MVFLPEEQCLPLPSELCLQADQFGHHSLIAVGFSPKGPPEHAVKLAVHCEQNLHDWKAKDKSASDFSTARTNLGSVVLVIIFFLKIFLCSFCVLLLHSSRSVLCNFSLCRKSCEFSSAFCQYLHKTSGLIKWCGPSTKMWVLETLFWCYWLEALLLLRGIQNLLDAGQSETKAQLQPHVSMVWDAVQHPASWEEA